MSEWISVEERLPPFNKLVVAYLEGAQEHSDLTWRREGFAFMARHENTHLVVKDGWACSFYDEALERIGADYASVTHWMHLDPPNQTAP